MFRVVLLSAVGFLTATPAMAQVQTIERDPPTGSAAAVIVPGSAPLWHTAQFVATTASDPDEQIDELIQRIKQIAQTLPAGPGAIVKLNFVVVSDDHVPHVERSVAKHFPGKQKPAVSFVTGKLPSTRSRLALDAVISVPAAATTAGVQITRDGALLPPGSRVWISGQAEKGVDLADATRKTMASLRDSLKFVGLKDNAVVQVKAFVQPIAQAETARREIEAFFEKRPAPPIIFVEWKSSLPIEIELIAWGGREREGFPIEYLTPPGMKASPVYSRITRVNHGKLIYISGLHAKAGDNPAEQITDVFDTLGGILKHAGSDYRHLAKATYYCTTADTVKKMGELRPHYYDPKRPPAASLAMTEGTGRRGKTMTLDMIAVPSPTVNVNEYGPPEYGHGLTEKDALDGWISLFDGRTTFGWNDAKLMDNGLQGGVSTSIFGPCQIRAQVVEPGELLIGDAKMPLTRGECGGMVAPTKPGAVRLAGGAVVRAITLRPQKMETLFGGKHILDWRRIDRLPKERRPTWTVVDGTLRAVGGPGALEYLKRDFGDLILQVEARMNVRYANGGLFFRAIPDDFMNGYEAQLYNRCHDGDVGKPWTWSTGAIDDRQNARRLVSRDGQWFVQTVIAHGPHIATWVNGYQTVDWTDMRAKHDNPRKGLRLEPGVIQLQAHDVGTDIEFRKVAAAPLE